MKTAMVNNKIELPRLSWKIIGKALLWAMAATVVLIGVLSALLTWTPLPEGFAKFGVMACVILANILGGMVISGKMRANGMMAGASLGLCYAVVIYLIGAIFMDKIGIDWESLIMYALAIFHGAIGGIIGVNKR